MIDQMLGVRMWIADFCVANLIGEEQAMLVSSEITRVLEMTPIEHTHTWRYPINDYKGGEGFTYAQPITESMVLVDSYTHIPAAYIIVRSCKPFDAQKVAELLEGMGLDVTSSEAHDLGLAQTVA